MGRGFIIALLLGFPSVSLISGIVLVANLKNFLNTTPRVESNMDLERFKRMVKRQMYAALLQIFLLGMPILIYGYGSFRGILDFGDVLYVVIPNTIIIIFSRLMRKHEVTGQTISSSTPELRSEVDVIINYWKKKALPNW